ncbi:MAG: DUF2461 domain-containing protein [Blastochloris sp.]|nr:DUF2461 domain-containing protein [Blastochloris sp.]
MCALAPTNRRIKYNLWHHSRAARLGGGTVCPGLGTRVVCRDGVPRTGPRPVRALSSSNCQVMETGPTLEAVVREIEAAGLTISGEMLKTVPRGYPRDHPRGGLLRYKSFIVGSILPADPVLTSRDAVIEHTVRAWRTAAPLNQWLDTNVGLSALSPEERWGRG